MQTYLDVADNTGAKQVQCTGARWYHRRYAGLGIVVASVKKAIPGWRSSPAPS